MTGTGGTAFTDDLLTPAASAVPCRVVRAAVEWSHSPRSTPRLTRFLPVASASGAIPAMRAAIRCAVSISSAAGTTFCTRPICIAVAASTRSPENMSSLVQCRPITEGARSTPKPGTSPTALSGMPNTAASDASTTSQASASSQPPPSA